MAQKGASTWHFGSAAHAVLSALARQVSMYAGTHWNLAASCWAVAAVFSSAKVAALLSLARPALARAMLPMNGITLHLLSPSQSCRVHSR